MNNRIIMLESALQAARANIAEKEAFIDKVVEDNRVLEKLNAELRKQIDTWIKLFQNTREQAG